MNHFTAHLVLAVTVLLGSAIPFVPTGELVSGAAAVASNSGGTLLAIFLITWVCAILGDTLMLMEARLGARKLRPWLATKRFAGRVEKAEVELTGNAFNAIVIGRLIPGARTPVIVAMGLSRFSVRRFIAIDIVASGLWALIYASVGSIGGRIVDDPLWAMAIAIAFALLVGVLVGQIPRFLGWLRGRSSEMSRM